MKNITQWFKNESKWNIPLFILVLWVLYVLSVSGDTTNPMNNGNGFIILSFLSIAGINILPFCIPSKKSIFDILKETNNIPKTLLMIFLIKTLCLYILQLLIWILHNALNPTLVMIFPASLMYWFVSSLSIILYAFCLFLRFSKSEYWSGHAYNPIYILFIFCPLSTRYTRFNYQVFYDLFKEYTIWILLLFLLFYTIGYLLIKQIIQKRFKGL